ncbi:MAG: NAD-dependent epimerase/dehydratase family protein [Flavobacteriia bacterium]|nr:NAD-dependent epimerase/dehydratase family protein [Flavobacteriia bacterium]
MKRKNKVLSSERVVPFGLSRTPIHYFRVMILVTGGTGLVGSHLLYRLSQSEKSVRALYRSESSLENARKVFGYYVEDVEAAFSRIEWVRADLFDIIDLQEAMKGVETVYHCAAVVSFQPSDKDLMLNGNPKMTGLLVNAALVEGVKSFIHVSSVAALGRASNGEMTNEKTEWKDSPLNSTYAESKYAAELEIWRGMEEGLTVGVVNPTIILGPGNWKSGSSKFFHTFYNGFKFYTEGQTGFVDVLDVVEAMLRIEEKKAFNKRFLLVSENIKYKQLFDLITSEYDVKPPSILPPRWAMELLWRVEWIRSKLTNSAPLVTKETAKTARNLSSFSNARAREELGMEFMPISESVKRNCELYLKDLKND